MGRFRRGAAASLRLMVFRHEPLGARARPGPVGKGVTFDTGGISIKPGDAWNA